MDSINLAGIFGFFQAFGPIGLVAIIWYIDMRTIHKVLARYEKDMAETRRMYENNVKLVEGYEGLAKDLKDIVIMNTQQMTHVSDQITQNEFCPMRRVEKKQIVREAGS